MTLSAAKVGSGMVAIARPMHPLTPVSVHQIGIAGGVVGAQFQTQVIQNTTRIVMPVNRATAMSTAATASSRYISVIQ